MILAEKVSEWFDIAVESPYMLLVANIHKNKKALSKNDENVSGIEKLYITRSQISAVTHVDSSARIQTLHKETNPRFINF